MDLTHIIDSLRDERDKVARAIVELERLVEEPRTRPARRGRTIIGPKERQLISERLKRYWAKRKHAADD